MLFRFKDQTFNTKLELDNFVMGYYYRLKEEQTDALTRCKELEKAIPFKN